MNDTPTPRTNAAAFTVQDAQNEGMRPDRQIVDAFLSRTIEKELAAVTQQRDRLADLVKQFIKILDITEESDGGRLFHPTNITSCRAGDLQKIGELVEALRRASRTNNPEPKEL